MAMSVSPQSVIAWSVITAKNKGKRLEIEDISNVLFGLSGRGLNIGEVAFRRVPRGVYSEDVEAFIGRILSAGYARARSPIDFFDDGLRICQKIVEEERKENPAGFQAAAEVVEEQIQQMQLA